MQNFQLRLPAALLCLIVLFSGCAPSAQPLPQVAPSADTTYYNDYLGLSITVPQGWQLNSLSENLSPEPGQTAKPLLSGISDGGGRLELLDIENSADSSNGAHCRFYAYADIFSEPPEPDQYLDLFISLLQADGGSYHYSLEKQEQLSLARHPAKRICVEVSAEGYQQPYSEEYYIVPLGSAFVVFYLNFWPENEDSRLAAQLMLEQLSLPAPETDAKTT